jgi:hypothetical protein
LKIEEILWILKFDILSVPPIQIPTKKGQTWVLLRKFHRRTNLTALLVTILGSRNKNKHSKFWYLTSQRYLLYKIRLEKDKPWVFLSKFRCRTILMHFLLPICGKFTRAQLAHQIFLLKKPKNPLPKNPNTQKPKKSWWVFGFLPNTDTHQRPRDAKMPSIRRRDLDAAVWP